MGTLVSALFAFCAHADILSLRVWGSVVQYCHDILQDSHTPLDILLAYFPQDSLMSSCNCIIMSFAYLLDPYAGFPDFEVSAIQPYSSSLSHIQPCRAIFYILCSLIPHFLLGGDFPPSVIILHMCPCIEHRYVPLLGTSLFTYMTVVSSQYVTIKQFYSFSSFSNI